MDNKSYISCRDLIRLLEVHGPMNNWKSSSGKMSRHVIKDENVVQDPCQMHVFTTCSKHLNKKYWTPNVCKVACGSRGHQKECYVISTLTSALKSVPKHQEKRWGTSGKEVRRKMLSSKKTRILKGDFRKGGAAQEVKMWFLFSKKLANHYRISFWGGKIL